MTGTLPARSALGGVVLTLSCLLAPIAGACGEKKPKEVRVSVVVILASEKGDGIDKKLAEIAKEVRKVHPKLLHFELANLSCKSLSVDKADKFELVEDQTAEVTILKAADKANKVCVKVAPPMMGEITYSTPCGKFLPILTPYKTKKGQTLILAVRVQPCDGGK